MRTAMLGIDEVIPDTPARRGASCYGEARSSADAIKESAAGAEPKVLPNAKLPPMQYLNRPLAVPPTPPPKLLNPPVQFINIPLAMPVAAKL